MESFFIILSFIIFMSLSIIVSIITFIKKKNNRLEKRTYLNIISKAAAKMGLKSNGTNIYGNYKDKLLTINYLGFDTENYKNRVKVRITNTKIPCSISILKKNSFFITNIRDYNSGDSNFDKLYCIRTDDDEVTTALLSKQLKKEIMLVFGKYNIIMENNTVSLIIENINNFENIINEIIAVLDKFNLSKEKNILFKKNIKEEKIKKIRIKNFKFLTQKKYSFDSNFYFSLLSEDEDPEIKILALTCLKEKGIEKLKKIFKNENQFKKIISKDVILILLNFLKSYSINDSYNWLIYTLGNLKEEILLLVFDLLKQINNINAVEYILPLTKGSHSNIIKKKAVETINILQKNIPESDKGNLAIIESDIGTLSITDKNEEGNLSLE